VNSGDILPAFVSLKFAFKKLATFCPPICRQRTPNPIVRRLLNILFENYTNQFGAIFCFVNLDTNIGRFKRRNIHITVRIQRSSAYLSAYSKNEEFFLLIQI